ncbi:DUF2550 family protein [Actinomyces urinae]|uniref:DUF2550 family protein n=1 Tax=Actinomyces urinae TaxID=1689268 RepID=UPI0009302C5B|nr:DUF2550 family protein [Actinomyces urinae]
MSVLGGILVALLVVLLALALCALVVLLIRVRRIGRIVGTFECWYRPDASAGWISGMARFGQRDLQWFRLVGFLVGPQLRMPREGMSVSAPIHRQEGVVEVVLTYGDSVRHLAMREEWYNGLVSWIESGPPRPREAY